MRHYLCLWNKKIVSKFYYYALIQNTYNGLILTFHTNSYILCSYLGRGGWWWWKHQKGRVAYFNNGENNPKGFWNVETSHDAMFVELSKSWTCLVFWVSFHKESGAVFLSVYQAWNFGCWDTNFWMIIKM